jgi:hypothetical protein
MAERTEYGPDRLDVGGGGLLRSEGIGIEVITGGVEETVTGGLIG